MLSPLHPALDPAVTLRKAENDRELNTAGPCESELFPCFHATTLTQGRSEGEYMAIYTPQSVQVKFL